MKISHCLENKKPLGTFSCDCGMIYYRSGEDKTEEDKLRIGRVIAYGEVWESKLRELAQEINSGEKQSIESQYFLRENAWGETLIADAEKLFSHPSLQPNTP